MKDDKQKERLGKIIALAKGGVGGEKETARRIAQALCEKLGIDFDEAMNEEEREQKFYIDFARKDYKLALQVVVRYAFGGNKNVDIFPSRDHTRVYFNTTLERYIETAHALDILSRLYRKEQKRMKEALWHAFLSKHDLYAKSDPKEEGPEISEEEMRARQMGGALSSSLEDAEIRKRISGK